MKQLEMKQMEMIEGGNAIDWTCVGIGVGGVLAGIFTAGAGTVAVLTVGGAYCVGYGAGMLLF
ncbi:MAG TPA: hypothetical protein VF623_12475 [Segetibacter sp.]|jgi:hypothetical protein